MTRNMVDCINLRFTGSLTQSVEYLPFKQRVVGSSPTRPTRTIRSPSSSQVQDTGLSRRQHRFKSGWGRHILKGIAPDRPIPFFFTTRFRPGKQDHTGMVARRCLVGWNDHFFNRRYTTPFTLFTRGYHYHADPLGNPSQFMLLRCPKDYQ